MLQEDGKKETRTSSLFKYGEPKSSHSATAMATLVGVPCAVGTLLVLDGKLSTPGLLAPVTPEIAFPIMDELKAKYGIELREKTLARAPELA